MVNALIAVHPTFCCISSQQRGPATHLRPTLIRLPFRCSPSPCLCAVNLPRFLAFQGELVGRPSYFSLAGRFSMTGW